MIDNKDDEESHVQGYSSENQGILSDAQLSRSYDYKPILCWRNPPPVVHKIIQEVTWERVKIFVLLVIMLTAAIVFSLKQQEEDHEFNLSAVTSDSPLIVDAKKTSSRNVLETILHIQRLEDESTREYPEAGVNVTITLQGSNDDDVDWTSLRFHEVEADNEEEVEDQHDFYCTDDDDAHAGSFDDYRFMIESSSDIPLGITFRYRDIYTLVRYEVVYAAIVLIGVYILIVFELMHRTVAAMIGAFVCLGVLSIVHARPTFEEIITWIDFETIGLLFGMMVMVGIFSNTGFFEYSAIKAYKMSRGNLWHLTVILCIFTAVVSAFLDNVTTILLLTPVTVRLCRVLDVKPEPILIAEVMFSNIGGTATPIGDPPNIIIVNDRDVSSHEDINFGSFTLHVAPGVILSVILTFFLTYFLFKRAIRREPHQGKLKEIRIWKRTMARVDENAGEEERRVKAQLEDYIKKLEEELLAEPEDDVKVVDVSELEAKYIIHDRPLFISSCCVLGGVIIMFFLHSWIEEEVELTLAWIAVIGAMIHLVVSGIHDVEEVLEKVEFGTLLFFASLFILMRGLEELGLITWIGDQVSDIVGSVPSGNGQLTVAILMIIWVSAFVSAFIDNIPYTTAMVPVVVSLSDRLDLPLAPLVWALSYGTCFGGNGTLIGASANVVACGLAEQQGYPISFNTFFKTGFPIMVFSVSVATVYMLVFHVLIPWY